MQIIGPALFWGLTNAQRHTAEGQDNKQEVNDSAIAYNGVAGVGLRIAAGAKHKPGAKYVEERKEYERCDGNAEPYAFSKRLGRGGSSGDGAGMDSICREKYSATSINPTATAIITTV